MFLGPFRVSCSNQRWSTSHQQTGRNLPPERMIDERNTSKLIIFFLRIILLFLLVLVLAATLVRKLRRVYTYSNLDFYSHLDSLIYSPENSLYTHNDANKSFHDHTHQKDTFSSKFTTEPAQTYTNCSSRFTHILIQTYSKLSQHKLALNNVHSNSNTNKNK